MSYRRSVAQTAAWTTKTGQRRRNGQDEQRSDALCDGREPKMRGRRDERGDQGGGGPAALPWCPSETRVGTAARAEGFAVEGQFPTSPCAGAYCGCKSTVFLPPNALLTLPSGRAFEAGLPPPAGRPQSRHRSVPPRRRTRAAHLFSDRSGSAQGYRWGARFQLCPGLPRESTRLVHTRACGPIPSKRLICVCRPRWSVIRARINGGCGTSEKPAGRKREHFARAQRELRHDHKDHGLPAMWPERWDGRHEQ